MTTPTAQLLVSVNSATPTHGGIVVSASATIAFSFADTTGWRSYILELLQPPGSSVPAGWTDGGSGLVSYTGVTAPPPEFTLPAITGWGKWLATLTVTMEAGVTLTDTATGLSMLSSSGLEDVSARERGQFNSLRSWAGALQTLTRLLETFLSGTLSASSVTWNPGGNTSAPIKSVPAHVTTTDDTATTLASYSLSDEHAVDFTVAVTAFRPSNGDAYRVDLGVTYKRHSAGAATIVGALVAVNERKDSGAGAWIATVDTDGANAVRVRVTGQASATIKWACEIRGQEVS